MLKKSNLVTFRINNAAKENGLRGIFTEME